MRPSDFVSGFLFAALGILLVAQGYFDRDWIRRRDPFDYVLWIRERFGKHTIRYLYLLSGISFIIAGTLIAFVPRISTQPLVIIIVMLVSFISTRFLLNMIENREVTKRKNMEK